MNDELATIELEKTLLELVWQQGDDLEYRTNYNELLASVGLSPEEVSHTDLREAERQSRKRLRFLLSQPVEEFKILTERENLTVSNHRRSDNVDKGKLTNQLQLETKTMNLTESDARSMLAAVGFKAVSSKTPMSGLQAKISMIKVKGLDEFRDHVFADDEEQEKETMGRVLEAIEAGEVIVVVRDEDEDNDVADPSEGENEAMGIETETSDGEEEVVKKKKLGPKPKKEKKDKKEVREKPAKATKPESNGKPAKNGKNTIKKVVKEKSEKVGTDKFGARKGSAVAAVNAVLSKRAKTMAEIVAEAGVKGTFYQHLKKLAEEGVIVKSDKGYSLK